MTDKKSPRTPFVLSPEALFVSAVKARELSGQGTDGAVREVAVQHHLTIAGEEKTCAVRSIYRWLAELDRDGPECDASPPSSRRSGGSAARVPGGTPLAARPCAAPPSTPTGRSSPTPSSNTAARTRTTGA